MQSLCCIYDLPRLNSLRNIMVVQGWRLQCILADSYLIDDSGDLSVQKSLPLSSSGLHFSYDEIVTLF